MTKGLEGDNAEKKAVTDTRTGQLTTDRVTDKKDIDTVDVFSHLKTKPQSAADADPDMARKSADFISKHFPEIDSAGKGNGKITAADIDSYISIEGSKLKPDELKAVQYAKEHISDIAKAHKDGILTGKEISTSDVSAYKDQAIAAEGKATARDFEAGIKSKDLSKVNAEIAEKQKELSKDDYKKYIAEVNKDLHASGVLPKDVSINDNSKVRLDDGKSLAALFGKDAAVLSVVDRDGNAAVVDRHGQKIDDLDPKHKADVPPLLPDTIKDRETGSLLDPFTNREEVNVKLKPSDNVPKMLDDFATAAFRREQGREPSAKELADERQKIVKANPSVFPKGKIPDTVSGDTEITVPIDNN